MDNMLYICDLRNLSWTCRLLYNVTRKYHFGVVSPVWKPAEISNIDIPISYYRHGVWSKDNDTFYLPIFHKHNPICCVLDLTNKPIKWIYKPLTIESSSKHQYEPVKYFAAAAIKNFIYIFGGENIDKDTITNIFYELNTYTFVLRVLNASNEKNIPNPRMMHTLDVIDNHRLAMFGGRSLIINENKKFVFDSKDFAMYDIKTETWTSYVQEFNIPYRRSLPSSHLTNGKLYIYGGQEYKCLSNSSQIHDDEDISIFDFRKEKWYKLLNPSIEKKISKVLLPTDWILTTSTDQNLSLGKRMYAAMFTMNNRIAIFGGSQIEVLTIFWKGWNFHEGLFLIGKDKREGKLIMGWVEDDAQII
ncbi:hypothetical protein C1645_752880 [Glomus cerebriforme]|uniref:Galactose oxidase n=1 Tax=Glomus cerebriforme TaxID=658196 RepID=A0A397TJZ2_9GLOM|nr:hypothetical protein C1645_752880 [Glomus cerebriforme]